MDGYSLSIAEKRSYAINRNVETPSSAVSACELYTIGLQNAANKITVKAWKLPLDPWFSAFGSSYFGISRFLVIASLPLIILPLLGCLCI